MSYQFIMRLQQISCKLQNMSRNPHLKQKVNNVILIFVTIIYHVLVCGIQFSSFSISTKILEHNPFFSSVNEEVYPEVYHLLDYYFSRLSSLLLSGKPVEVKC